ncbi:MAG TPA: hypothetical protein VGK16_10245 [Candidatus Limnocylindrales bacterium]
MSSSEIAFLAIGLIIGAAIGAAIAEGLRARPAPRGQVRVTISPNSVSARRSTTLSDPSLGSSDGSFAGSPEDGAWNEGPTPSVPATPLTATATAPILGAVRTPVPSPVAGIPISAVAVPVQSTSSVPVGPGVPAARPVQPATRPSPTSTPGGGGSPYPLASASVNVASPPMARVAVGVLDPIAPLTEAERARVDDGAPGPVRSGVSVLDVGATAPGTAVRPRPPVAEARPSLPGGAVGVPIERPRAHGREASSDEAAGGAAAVSATPDPCDPPRRLVEERCALASASREHARAATDALRESERAYDSLRGLLDQAEKASDPRELALAKDELHRRFRAASDAAADAEAAEAAARAWLDAINDLNGHAREAARFLDSGKAELEAALPRIRRLTVEAETARKRAEIAAAGCQEARESLAACEEASEARRATLGAGPPNAEDPHPFDALWPGEADTTRTQPMTRDDAPPPAAIDAVALRILRGDRAARERLVASLAGGDVEASRAWHLQLSRLVDAIVARAIEDGYVDLPDEDPFWGLFSFAERREIVGALSALGYRFDGLRGFADGRIPAARDLSLAVGYAGLDRMRIRTWPREAELARLYEGAMPAADDWLIAMADDLSLGRMVDALGARAGDLADTWNAWGRVRPLLLSTD